MLDTMIAETRPTATRDSAHDKPRPTAEHPSSAAAPMLEDRTCIPGVLTWWRVMSATHFGFTRTEARAALGAPAAADLARWEAAGQCAVVEERVAQLSDVPTALLVRLSQWFVAWVRRDHLDLQVAPGGVSADRRAAAAQRRAWWTAPREAAPFDGRAPRELLATGTEEDFARLWAWVEAAPSRAG